MRSLAMPVRCSYDGSLPPPVKRRPSLRRLARRAVRVWPLRLAALIALAASPAAVPPHLNRVHAEPGHAAIRDGIDIQASWEAAKAAAERGDLLAAQAMLAPLAELGLSQAQAELGRMHLNGATGRPDPVRAERLLLPAAEAGIVTAQFDLATLFDGRATSGATQQALRWYRRAAEAGHAEARFRLADMVAEGRGCPSDDLEAARLLLQAAEQGHAQARAQLGALYLKGRGVPQDYEIAMKWLFLAAEVGEASAQGMLGAMYLAGRSVTQDYVAAHQWFNLSAAAARDTELRQRSAANRDLAAARMSREDVAEAQRRAREWKPRS